MLPQQRVDRGSDARIGHDPARSRWRLWQKMIDSTGASALAGGADDLCGLGLSVRRRDGMRHKALIKGEIAACRLLPTKILSHCLPLHLPPGHGLPIQSERPFYAANHIIACR